MQNQNDPQKQSQDKPAQPPPDTNPKSTLVLLDVKKLSGKALDIAIDKIASILLDPKDRPSLDEAQLQAHFGETNDSAQEIVKSRE